MLTATVKSAKRNFSWFCNNLKLISEYFHWNVDNSTFSIRAYKRNRSFCPITAVAYALLGKFYKVSEWQIAAKKLNLNLSDASLIMQASDSSTLYNGEMQEYYDQIAMEVCR